MRVRSIGFHKIAAEKTLRFDFVYNNHFSDNEWTLPFYTFDELFEIVDEKYDYQALDGIFQYCQIGDVTKDGEALPVSLNFDERDLLEDSYYKKIEKGDIISVAENDFLLSFLLPQDVKILAKMVRITSDISNVFFTDAFIRIRPRRMPEILFYAIRNLFYQDLVAVSRIRKGYTGYSTLDTNDMRKLKFGKATIDALAEHSAFLQDTIRQAESNIKKIKGTLESTGEIIDRVFAKHFGFDYDKFEKLKKIKVHYCGQKDFSKNPDLRFSPKFHRDAGAFVIEQLTAITEKKIKHFLSEPIVLGASISPAEYDESGEYYYISMATIKSWAFDPESASTVSAAFSSAKSEKTIKKNDIILARSGEGTIGKVALIDDAQIHGVFADFTMRIRLKNYNPEFAYFYFRTSYFQYLVEVYKKGLGNNTNIFPIAVQEFPMLDISLADQDQIVAEIHTELTKQNLKRVEIEQLRKGIDKTIIQMSEGEENYL